MPARSLQTDQGMEPAGQGAGAACLGPSRGLGSGGRGENALRGGPEVVERPPVHSGIPQTAGAGCPVALPSF